MTERAGQPALAEVLASLQKDRESLPWDRRREVAQNLAEAFSTFSPADHLLALAHLLAEDPKWEVRKDVADLLPMLPPKDFAALAPMLAKDSNVYVRRSAERALARRTRAELEDRHAKRGTSRIASQFESFERQHGPAARKQAQRICDLYKDMLVGTMLHDLRSILTHLKTNGRALIQDAETRGEVRAKTVAGRLADGLVSLERTLKDMDEYSTPPELKNHREPVREVVGAALEMARSNIREGGFDPDAVAVAVEVSESMVFEVTKPLVVMALTNIIKNAFEAFARPDGTLGKGRVVIEAVQDGEATRLVVRDGGKGFSAEEWTAYTVLLPGRVNKTKRRSTGYGLAIARRNIEAHGGRVHIDTKEDKGTVVTITVPVGGRTR
jgi:signal transduction histidine kinase